MNVFRPLPKPDPVREKFARARRELSAALVEREEGVGLALTALLAGEHLLLVGPPGCGQSPLLDSAPSRAGGTRSPSSGRRSPRRTNVRRITVDDD